MIVSARDAPAVRYRGGVVVIRCADFLADARATLEVADPDAQATSGQSVWESQTAADLASAGDTLSIPFSALPLTFGISYRIHVFYRTTGTGEDDDEQRFTERRLFAWGFKSTFAGHPLRTRSEGFLDNAAVRKTLFSVPHAWFGLTDLTIRAVDAGLFDELHDAAYNIDPSESLNVAVFKTEGTGAIVLDQIVMLPLQVTDTDSTYVYDDTSGGGAINWRSPWPPYLVNAHDETDEYQGSSIAEYKKVTDVADAEIVQNDPASFNGDFVLGAVYECYALAAVHLPASAILKLDEFNDRTRYPDWGNGWAPEVVGSPNLIAAVLPDVGFDDVVFKGAYESVGTGHYNPPSNYLVYGSDGLPYHFVGTTDGSEHDPVTDMAHEWWEPVTGGNAGYLAAHPETILDEVADLRVTLRANSTMELFGNFDIETDGLVPAPWAPWSVRVRTGEGTGGQEIVGEAHIDEDGALYVRIERRGGGGGETTLAGPHLVAASYTANDWWWLMFEAVGSTFRAKLWKDGDAEPDWQLDVTDNPMNFDDQGGGFAYVYGRTSVETRRDFPGSGTEPRPDVDFVDENGNELGVSRFNYVKVERAGGSAETAKLAYTRSGTDDLVLGPEEVPSTRNWVWLDMSRALVWEDPDHGLDLRAWNPETAQFWQSVNVGAMFCALAPAAPVFDISWRAERP